MDRSKWTNSDEFEKYARLGLGYTAFAAQNVPRPASRKAGLGFPSLSGSKEYERLWSPP